VSTLGGPVSNVVTFSEGSSGSSSTPFIVTAKTFALIAFVEADLPR
jgi:hypothetical protein